MPPACQAMSSEAAEEASESVAIRQSVYTVGSMADLERKHTSLPGEAEEKEKDSSYVCSDTYPRTITVTSLAFWASKVNSNRDIDQSPIYEWAAPLCHRLRPYDFLTVS